MNSHTSVAVKGQSIGLVTAIVHGESQSSKEVMNHIVDRLFGKIYFLVTCPWFKEWKGKGNGSVIGLLDIAVQHTLAAIPG